MPKPLGFGISYFFRFIIILAIVNGIISNNNTPNGTELKKLSERLYSILPGL